MPKRTRKESQDINQFAADVLRQTIEEEPIRRSIAEPSAETPTRSVISQVMAAMGRKGGLKGAATLNAKLTPGQRKKSAQRAARARWGKKGGNT
jgi:hypothetical protein